MKFIPQPVRPKDQPFLMPVEDVFSISGRGTVVTGRIERGIVKVGEEIEIIGIRPTVKSVVTGVEMFKQAFGFRPRPATTCRLLAARHSSVKASSAVRCWRSRATVTPHTNFTG